MCQLVLKDGIKLDEEFTKSIKRISEDIVSMPKVFLSIAGQFRS